MIDLHLNIDISTLPEAEAKKKIDDINRVSEFFAKQNSFEESRYCADNALLMSEKINYPKGIAHACRNIGEIHFRRNEFKEAMLNLSEAVKLFIQINDKSSEGNTYINLAISYRHLDEYITMIELCFKALNIFREINDESNEGFILTVIGNYYLEVREYDLAIEYYSMSLKIHRKEKNIWRIILVIYNIGLAFYNQSFYNTDPLQKAFLLEKSLKYYRESSSFNEKINKSTLLKYRIARNIAMVHGYQEKFEEAEKIFLDCLEHYRKVKDKIEICETLSDLGDLYLNMKQNDKAEKTLSEAEKLAAELESKRLQLSIAGKFLNFFHRKNDYKSALEYYRRFTIIEFERNNTLVENNIRKLNIMHTVDITKKETQILSEKNEQLKAMNEKLLKLNNDKNYFMNLAAIDLKIPLEKISLILNNFESKIDSPENKLNNLSEILRETSGMEKIIADLLAVNESESAK